MHTVQYLDRYTDYVTPDIFKLDPNYLDNEEKYKSIKAEILGEDSDDDESGSGGEESSDEDDEEGSYLLQSYPEFKVPHTMQLPKPRKVSRIALKQTSSTYAALSISPS
jgi:hypothetical protein